MVNGFAHWLDRRHGERLVRPGVPVDPVGRLLLGRGPTLSQSTFVFGLALIGQPLAYRVEYTTEHDARGSRPHHQ